MPTPLYETLNKQNPVAPSQNPIATIQSAVAQIKANPAQMLSQAGLKIPTGMTDPNQILNHLLQSGQINQGRLAQAQQMAMRFKF